MRRILPALFGALAVAALALGGTAGAANLEPVTVTATAPDTVEAGKRFELEVTVEAEAGALDIAAVPLTLGVKLAPECGGSLAGTPGSPVLAEVLPNPRAGAVYSQTVSGALAVAEPGVDVVCAFLQDTQERQFATDTEEEVKVVAPGGAHGCAAATARARTARRSLRRLDRRIAKTRRKLPRAHGAHRRALKRKLRKLRVHRRNVLARRRAAARQVAAVCS